MNANSGLDFEACLSAHDLNEMNIEIIRNTLYKAYIEDFYTYCQSLDEVTAHVMGEILEVSPIILPRFCEPFSFISTFSL